MGNRSEADREAIASSMDAVEKNEAEGTLNSRYVHEAVGVPNDPDVIAAIDAWANVWGNEVISLVNHEGLLDMNIAEQRAASEHLGQKAEELAKLLPNAKFLSGQIIFDGGHVQLSA